MYPSPSMPFGFHRFVHGMADLIGRQGDIETNRPGGMKKAFDVRLFLENLAVVDADALEHAVAVQQAMVKHADLCFGNRNEFMPKPNLEIRVGGRTGYWTWVELHLRLYSWNHLLCCKMSRQLRAARVAMLAQHAVFQLKSAMGTQCDL